MSPQPSLHTEISKFHDEQNPKSKTFERVDVGASRTSMCENVLLQNEHPNCHIEMGQWWLQRRAIGGACMPRIVWNV